MKKTVAIFLLLLLMIPFSQTFAFQRTVVIENFTNWG